VNREETLYLLPEIKTFSMRTPMVLLFLFTLTRLEAQSRELIIRGVTGNLHLDHSVAAKENWYSIGRLYNVDPKALARYNHLTFQHPLEIGQELKIPLTAQNFSQDRKKPASETLVPVYHIVQEKEWLYRISVNHNKVPIPVLEKWNHVTGDQLHPGLHLIVGYLKVRTALSALAKQAPPETAMAVMSPESEKAVMPAETAKPVKPAETAKAVMPAETKAPKDTGLPAKPAGPPAAAPHFGGGRFKEDFSDGGRSVSGLAGTFKSTSGWQDGKYYALINDVPVGTIIKITDESDGNIVYAKVLGQLPEMKESAGLTVRLSDAAAAELGEAEGRFSVVVRY